MVTIAVAGGTGGIGKTITAELLARKKHKVIVLSRKASPIPNLDVPVLAADYSNVEALRKILEDEKVEVVISAIIMASQQSSDYQLNLIAAASQTPSVKRFMPSEYGVNYSSEMLSFHPTTQFFLSAVTALRNTRLEFTRVVFGWVSDFLGTPHFPSYLSPFKFVLDFDKRRAVMPGEGKDMVTFLHSSDVGRYVAALVEDPKEWGEVSAFAASRMSWREVVGVAEEVTGAKWDITYDSVEQLEKGEATVLGEAPPQYGLDEAGLKALYAEFELMCVRGITDVAGAGLKNDEYPHIKPLSVRDVIEAAWGKKAGV